MWKETLLRFVASAGHPLVVILGPTASGKTAFSIRLATRLRRQGKKPEIINADSRQLYKGLEIGTAKITPEEAEGIPHHLFSVLDPGEEVTIARYQEMATTIIEEIRRRGGIPLLVGGSMLYISAIIDGLQPLDPVDPTLRKKLEDAYDRDGGVSLYQRLLVIDPETASAFHRNNKPYVVRALEILESTGAKPSEKKKTSSCPYDLLILGIERPRADIATRIAERTHVLLRKGWIEEVRKLLDDGVTADAPAMQSHGYREIVRELRAGRSIDDIKNDAKLREDINIKTRQYAKRQMTWWKHDQRIVWMPPEALTPPDSGD